MHGPRHGGFRPHPEKPGRIVSQPSGKVLKFKYKDGKAVFKVDSLDIYDIIEIS